MRIHLPAVVAVALGFGLALLPISRPAPELPRGERMAPVRLAARHGGVPRVAVSPFAPRPEEASAVDPDLADTEPALAEPELAELATAVGGVFRQDLEFEGALDLLPAEAVSDAGGAPATGAATGIGADGASGVPSGDGAGVPSGAGAIPFEAWRARGADGLVVGSVERSGEWLLAEVRLYDASAGELVYARGYRGPASSPRRLGHAIADEFLQAQAGIHSVSLTQLAFVSDRGGMRRELGGMMRRFKEIWVADYDGDGQRRVTSDRDLNMNPSWSPDGALIAYTSFRRGYQAIQVSLVERRAQLDAAADPGAASQPGSEQPGRTLAGGNAAAAAGAIPESPARSVGKSWLPAWSPDGSRLAFTSNRDGNAETYVVDRDGANLQRLTRHWAIDTSPAWSPSGAQIAFTSDRTGRPQIWVMSADGSDPRALTAEKYCDRPTWSPPPENEIAYVSRTTTGFDIKVKHVDTGAERQLTHGEGFNESPAWSPNGRHLAFTSTRRGGQQVWTMTRTGERLRQVTSVGNNTMPAWSCPPSPTSSIVK